MLMDNTRRGVCAACIHEPECTLPRDFDRPPLQCEEFELAVRAGEAPRAPAAVPRERPEGAGYPGLCANCDNRHMCTYPKPEGGIWRCDEYV